MYICYQQKILEETTRLRKCRLKMRAAVNKGRLSKASLSYRNRYFRRLEQKNDN